MVAEYLTLLVISSVNDDTVYGAIPFQRYEDCEFSMDINTEIITSNDMMLQCLETNIVTKSPVPVPRPDNLMEAYDD